MSDFLKTMSNENLITCYQELELRLQTGQLEPVDAADYAAYWRELQSRQLTGFL